jgi:hypothetical protein
MKESRSTKAPADECLALSLVVVAAEEHIQQSVYLPLRFQPAKKEQQFSSPLSLCHHRIHNDRI